mgnify:CR=1 FL=1
MDPINMVLFRKEETGRLIDALKLRIADGFIVDETGERVSCHTCGVDIKKSNLGNVMPGSKLFFCDNPACFATYVVEQKI